MLANTRWLAAACAAEILPTRFLRLTAPKAFLTPQLAAPLNTPVPMALAPILMIGMRRESTPSPRCQGRLGGHLGVDTNPARRSRRCLRPRRAMLPMERERARTLFFIGFSSQSKDLGTGHDKRQENV